MTTSELRDYVYEQHRQGMNDSQIAYHLGMSVDELAKKLDSQPEKKAKKPAEPKKQKQEKTDIPVDTDAAEGIVDEI